MPLGRLYSCRDDHPVQCCSAVGQQIDKRQRQRCREVLADGSIELQEGDGRLEPKERDKKQKRSRQNNNGRKRRKTSVSEARAGKGDSVHSSSGGFASRQGVRAAKGQKSHTISGTTKNERKIEGAEIGDVGGGG